MKKGIKRFVLFSILYLVCNIFISPKYLVIPVYSVGHSMEPTLDYHSFSVFVFPNNLYRGDIVSVDVKQRGEKTTYIKRIIGLPGEQVSIHDAIVYINDSAYFENYVDYNECKKLGFIDCSTDEKTFEQFISLSNLEGEVIPDDYYLILGDNRLHSVDSRSFGFVHKSQIKGKLLNELGGIKEIDYDLVNRFIDDYGIELYNRLNI